MKEVKKIMEEVKGKWVKLEVAKGTLISVDREERNLTYEVEHDTGDHRDPIYKEEFTIPIAEDFSDEDYEELGNYLGDELIFKLKDGQLFSYSAL
jgi:hypothetical protein